MNRSRRRSRRSRRTALVAGGIVVASTLGTLAVGAWSASAQQGVFAPASTGTAQAAVPAPRTTLGEARVHHPKKHHRSRIGRPGSTAQTTAPVASTPSASASTVPSGMTPTRSVPSSATPTASSAPTGTGTSTTPATTAAATAPPSTTVPSTTTPSATPSSTSPVAAALGVPFAASSPWNQPIPASPRLDASSAAIAVSLGQGNQAYAGLVEFGIPIYEATASTPKKVVSCGHTVSWGACPLDGVTVPVDPAWKPSPGSDGAMVVIDRTAGRSYEFWQASNGSGVSATWAGSVSLTGNGWDGVATATGASRLGGVIRTAELQQGVIPHALSISSSQACSGVFRAPAAKTDGQASGGGCVPEGSRIQLDPSIDLSTLSLTPAERTIATALQTYGAYVVDKGGARVAVAFQTASDASGTNPGATYRALGLDHDYQQLSGIPWSKLRVLASWSGE